MTNDIDALSPLSYSTIKNTLSEFRRRGSRGSAFSELDSPGHLFFKIIFHFFNGDTFRTDSNALENGLLAPTWSSGKSASDEKDDMERDVDEIMSAQNNGNDLDPDALKYANSAYNYLIRNDELERAEKLKQFITLLSSISTYSPWYFQEVTGLDNVLERPFKIGQDYKIEDPKQITIKCLPDAMDNRIATLLDLYRDVAYSHTWHKEILPANLRRFDMSIYIFSSPIINLHKDAVMNLNDRGTGNFVPSYKCIELHDCEFDYNLSKSGYSSLNNAEGFTQTFEIPITVGDAYEYRYNMFMDRTIGDIVAIDMIRNSYSGRPGHGKIDKLFIDKPQETADSITSALKNRIDMYKGGSIDLFRIVDDLTGNVVSSTIKTQLLGNIYKTSISDMSTNLSHLAKNIQSGNIGAVINNAKGISEIKNGWYVKSVGKNNIFNR